MNPTNYFLGIFSKLKESDPPHVNLSDIDEKANGSPKQRIPDRKVWVKQVQTHLVA
jgi:hypothetical protein